MSTAATNYLSVLATAKKYLIGIFFILFGLALFGTSQSIFISLSNFLALTYGVPEGILYISYIVGGFWVCYNAWRRKDINGISITPFLLHTAAASVMTINMGHPYVSLPVIILAVYVSVDLLLMVFPPRLWKYLRHTTTDSANG